METQFITDQNGKRVSAVLPIKVYHQMLEELEELHDIQLYDEAKSRPSEPIPAEDAFQLIEQQRRS